MANSYIYDIEQFPNIFCVTFIDVNMDTELLQEYIDADIDNDYVKKAELLPKLGAKTFVIYENINHAHIICDFLRNVSILIGYNNQRYDDLMLDYLVMNKNAKTDILIGKLYNFSQILVNYEGYNIRKDLDSYISEYSNIKTSIDVMRLNYFDKLKISLKKVEVGLKWHRVEDLPLPFNKEVSKDDVANIIDYNINDVLATHKLFLFSIGELSIRQYTIKKYEFTGRIAKDILSASRSKLANILVSNYYSDATGQHYREFSQLRTNRHTIKLNEIIDENITFKTKQFIDLLIKIKNTKLYVYDNKFSEDILVGDNYKLNKYILKTGGLHSEDRPGVFVADSEYFIRDCDVGSYYPSILINRDTSPSHLIKRAFISIVKLLTESRLKAKADGNSMEADVYKIIINAIYGKLGDEYSFLKDHAALYNITFNGQLYLLVMAEDFALNNIKVISINTDGVVVRLHKSQEKLYYDICDKWQQRFNFKLEYTDYVKYVRTSVNDYLAIKPNGNIKLKGDFEYNISLEKGYSRPIVPLSIYNYFVHGTPIEDTIRTHTNIYDFCLSSKISADFDTVFTTITNREVKEEILSKTTRFYITDKNSKGGYIFKRYKTRYNRKTISMCKHRKVTIFNDFYRVKEFKDYNIDYSYYIGEANKMLYKISGQINNVHRATSSKKRISGTLFDEIDDIEELNINNKITMCGECFFQMNHICTCEDSDRHLDEVADKDKCKEFLPYSSDEEGLGNDDDDDDEDD